MSEIPNLHVCSPASFSGKTTICLGLALKFKEEGYKVGYFKPLCCETKRDGKGRLIDEDIELMKHVLNLKEPYNVLSPIILTNQFLDDVEKDLSLYQKKILEAYSEVSQGKDVMILEGPRTLGSGSCLKIDPATIAGKIDSNILLVSKIENDTAMCDIVQDYNCIVKDGVKFIGVVLNYVPKIIIERVRGFYRPTLEYNNVKVLGVVPENIDLQCPTVQEIHDKLGGEILSGEENLDNLVEDFVVGAMTPESALTYLRRSVNKAVITGGDRSDILLAALQTDTSVLVLTGNLHPDVRVLSRAKDQGIPVLLVPNDTYTTLTMMNEAVGRIHYREEKKIQLAKKTVEENVRWKDILGVIGL